MSDTMEGELVKNKLIYDWGTWKTPNKEEPKVWHHDIFRKDGTPYSAAEANFIKEIKGTK